jgi:hypothetical protein
MHDQLPPRGPVIVTLPTEVDLINQDWAYDQLCAALASGADIVIADFTATTFCDCSSMRCWPSRPAPSPATTSSVS